MGRRTTTRKLDVLMNGEMVGKWTLTSAGSHEFAYADTWVASPFSRPLSLSLPIRKKKYTGDSVYFFFDNLLPNSDAIRKRIRDRFATGSIDAFQLLAEIGRDCVGAIQLLPSGVESAPVHKILAEPVADQDIEQLLARTVAEDAFGRFRDENRNFRISLAGAQEKTALLRHDGKWKIPHGATPTTHIFKLPLGRMGHFNIDMTTSVENEWLCSNILQAYGLAIASSRIARFGDMKILIVERFDRQLSPDSSWIMRLPQEDMCQATGTPPWKKYESDGGPGIREIMNLLLGSSRAEQDRIDFFRAQAAFFMLCAIDGHAKNFSLFIRQGGRYQLTPLYDVLSAYPVMGHGSDLLSPHKVKMAMAVWGRNRHYSWDQIRREHFLRTGSSCGLTEAICNGILEEMIRKTPSVIQHVSGALPADFPDHVASSIFQGLEQTAKRLS